MKHSQNDPTRSSRDNLKYGTTTESTRNRSIRPFNECKKHRYSTTHLSSFIAFVLLLTQLLTVQAIDLSEINLEPKTFRIFSLNAFIRPLFVGTDDFNDERLSDLRNVVSSYDILCIQELFWSAGPRKARFLEAISALGFANIVSPQLPGVSGIFQFPPKFVDSGLVIASRYPIERYDDIVFDDSSSKTVDFFVAKGVLYTRLFIPSYLTKYVHLFTTHMQANDGLERMPFDEIRTKQLHQMVEFITDATEDDPLGNIIITGDFNIDGRKSAEDGSSSAEYERAVEILGSIRPNVSLRDVVLEVNNGSHPVTFAGGLQGENGGMSLDYIFVSPSSSSPARPVAGTVLVNELQISERPYKTLSDHFAVEALFEV